MGAIAFDTMGCADELVKAGIPEQQAKAQAKALKSVIDEVFSSELDSSKVWVDSKSRPEKYSIFLEVLMSIMLAILAIPVLKDLLT